MLKGSQIAALAELAGIAVAGTEHRGRPVLLLRFAKGRREVVSAIRRAGGQWSRTHDCWTVLRDAVLLERVLKEAGYGVRQLYPGIADVMETARRQIDLKGYSPATRKVYLSALEGLLVFFEGADPATIEKSAIEDYLLYLAKDRNYAEASVHSAMNGIRFYYEKVLRRPKAWFDIYRPKKPAKDPRFFSREDITAILNAVTNLKHKAILMLCYSAGLRVSEVVRLRMRQIDSNRMCIYIEAAKGKKDRVAILSPAVLVILREYARQYRPKDYLFEGAEAGMPYSTRSAQKILEDAKKRAGVIKPGSIHALRHSFATHLLDKHTDVTMIQKLLGHADIKTTLRYLHVTNRDLLQIVSPLDDL